MPAELIEAARERLAELPERHRWERQLLRRVHGVAREPGHAHHARVHVVVGRERRVVDRPVVADAVERPRLEIGRMKAWEMGGVEDRRRRRPR